MSLNQSRTRSWREMNSSSQSPLDQSGRFSGRMSRTPTHARRRQRRANAPSSSSGAPSGNRHNGPRADLEFQWSSDDLRRLKAADVLIQDKLMADEKADDVLDNLSTHHNGVYYYNNTLRMRTIRPVPMPSPILDQFDYYQFYSISGLFPEISRAWITVDNKLYLWNYLEDHGQEFTVFDQLSQIIVAAALVTPKPGCFPPEVQFVLAVATPVEIVLLQTFFENDEVSGELELVASKYVVPSDNVHMKKIIGTPDGRIFMGGKDGNLYEMVYEAQAGWFQHGMNFKCRKLNHSTSYIKQFLPSFLLSHRDDPVEDIVYDPSRKYLYTLSRRDVIRWFYLGAKGDQLQFLCEYRNIWRDAYKAVSKLKPMPKDFDSDYRQLPDKRNFNVVNLSIIPKSDARKVCLVAVTNHGHRVFLYPKFLASSSLGVKFVRLCPPFLSRPSGKGGPERKPNYKERESPSHVRHAYYRRNLLLLVDDKDDQDVLITINPDSTAATGNTSLRESVEKAPTSRKIRQIAELPPEFYMNFTAASLYASDGGDVPLEGLSIFAVQHALPPRQLLCLTPTSLLRMSCARPVDELRAVLVRRAVSHSDHELLLFSKKFGDVETCAMLLILACGGTFAESISIVAGDMASTSRNISRRSLNQSARAPASSSSMHNTSSASRRFGGMSPLPDTTANGGFEDTKLDDDDDVVDDVRATYGANNVAPITDEELRLSAATAFVEWPRYPTHPTAHSSSSSSSRHSNMMGRPVMSIGGGYSHQHDSLYTYLSRLLRPVWTHTVVVPIKHHPYLQLRYELKSQLLDLQAPLKRFKEFVQTHSKSLSVALRAPRRPLQNVNGAQLELKAEQDAQAAEYDSLLNLRLIVDMAIEAFSLLILLSEDDVFPFVVQRFPISDRDRLERLRFAQLVTDKQGEETARALIAAMKEVPDESGWVERLHVECPHFFGEADLLHYRALQNINTYKENFHLKDERERFINRALEHYRSAARSRLFPLAQVCRNLRSVHYYHGAVSLCVYRARLLREGDIPPPRATSTLNPNAADDFIHQATEEAYHCILQTLDSVLCGIYPRGEEPTEDSLYISKEEREWLGRESLKAAVECEVPEFHMQLYQNLLKRNRKDLLLEIRSPYIVRFLTSHERYIDTLLEYYQLHEMYRDAAVLLNALAKREGDVFTLERRIVFLNRAYIFAQKASTESLSSSMADEVDPNMVYNLRERIEIAKTQLKLYNAVFLQLGVLKELEEIELRRVSEDEIQLTLDEEKEQREEIHQRFADERNEFERALTQLDTKLLSWDELNMLAIQLSLWDVCLHIIAATPTVARDYSTVETLYGNIIKKEIRLAAGRGDWPARVRKVVISLANEYLNKDQLFPLEFVTQLLEDHYHRFVDSDDHTWVVDTLIQAGVPAARLLAVYDLLLQSASVSDPAARIAVCASVYHLVKSLDRPQHARWNRSQDDIARAELVNKVAMELNSLQTHSRARKLKRHVDVLHERLARREPW